MFYSYLGDAALPDNKYKKFIKITNDMLKVYSTTKLCDYYDKEKCNLSLDPGILMLIIIIFFYNSTKSNTFNVS